MKQGIAGGFTIIELLLATTVFSLVMLGALVGFLQTGRLFYKGVSVTQTQATAKYIMDDITSSINSTSAGLIPAGSTSGGYTFNCIGNVRYTYNLNPANPLDLSAPHDVSAWTAGGNFGLLRDRVNGCTPPCVSGCLQPLTNAVEMLGDRMRLSTFSISLPVGKLVSVILTLMYGDNGSISGTPPACVGNSQNQQFCAVSTLTTSASAGF